MSNLSRCQVTVTEAPAILLFDNGSLRPEPTLGLRRIAAELNIRLGRPVTATSLLHSDRVDPARLEGCPAILLEGEIRRQITEGRRSFTLVPYFIGPSLALTEYLPERLETVAGAVGSFSFSLADSLVHLEPEPDLRLAHLLAAQVARTMDNHLDMIRPRVVMVDHGSPARAVARVRNALAEELARILGDRVEKVEPASMERRDGAEYDFNEPLLARALDLAGPPAATTIVSLLFLSSGRHAGPDGDITRICRQAERANPGLRTVVTGLPSECGGIIDILLDRIREAEVRLEPT